MVNESREELLQNMIDVVARYMDEEFWHRKYWCLCSGSEARRECAEHAYVSLAIKLRGLGLWPTAPSISAIEDSAVELREKLYAIQTVPYTGDHSECSALSEQFQMDISLTSYHFNVPDVPMYEKHFDLHPDYESVPLSGLLGTYMFHYGFTEEDFGFVLILKDQKQRRHGIQESSESGDEKSDDQEDEDDEDDESAAATDEELDGQDDENDSNHSSDWESDTDSTPEEEYIEDDEDEVREEMRRKRPRYDTLSS